MPYFAMRLIDGRNLAEVVAELRERNRGGLPPRHVAEVGGKRRKPSTMPTEMKCFTVISNHRIS